MQTGPKTGAGKAASSMNAATHGLTSSKTVLPNESLAAYERLEHCLMDEHAPGTPTEIILVEEMARAHWRLNRVRCRQDAAFAAESLDPALLAVLHRYATTYERSFFKALQTLKSLQRERYSQSAQSFVSQKAKDAKFLAMVDQAMLDQAMSDEQSTAPLQPAPPDPEPQPTETFVSQNPRPDQRVMAYTS